VTAIHALPGCAAVPVILLTALGSQIPRNTATAVVSKPVRRRPLRDACIAALYHQRQQPSVRTPPPANVLRVLVADHRLGGLRTTAQALTRLGCAVDVVDDGDELLTAAARIAYAAVVITHDLPPHGSEDAKRRLAHLGFAGSIVVITGSPDQNELARLLGLPT
jgi:CheY-like chemotaxis protein